MVDSVAVFPANFRITDDDTGAPLSGAVIKFYDAGTTNPKTVYADRDLGTTLGTSVITDSQGAPTSDGSTETNIYVGTAPYKIRIETSAGVLVEEKDDIPGAVETVNPSDLSVGSSTPVLVKSLDYTVLAVDQNSLIVVNCSGGDVTLTLPSAVDVGDGWGIKVSHGGSANQALIETASAQTISSGATSYAAVIALSFSGEYVELVSDGGNWRVAAHCGPHIKRATGVLTVADRLTSPPGSEVQGALYLISGAPSGDWSSFAEHDLVQFTDSAWVKFTPPTDCGWLAYVQDEDIYYRFIGSAWVAESATTSVPGTVELATNAETVTATDSARVAPLSAIRHHPGAAKVWGIVTYSGGTPTLQASHNVTSITDTAEGRLTVTIADDFSSALYVVVGNSEAGTGNPRILTVSSGTRAAGSFEVSTGNTGGSNVDPSAIHFACYGTLA